MPLLLFWYGKSNGPKTKGKNYKDLPSAFSLLLDVEVHSCHYFTTQHLPAIGTIFLDPEQRKIISAGPKFKEVFLILPLKIIISLKVLKEIKLFGFI